jgi:F-type H+-transporting ATPase subunit gamma
MPGAGAVRAIRDRIRSVQSTAKVTKAMQLVAASKMRRAQDRALSSRPYADRMRAVLSQLSGYAQGADPAELHPLLRERSVRHFAFIHITADRGLAGGLNANMNRAGATLALEHQPRVERVSVVTVGRKGRDFFRRAGFPSLAEFTELGDYPGMARVLPIARVVMDDYMAGNIDQVYIGYQRFVSTAVQRPTLRQILPVRPPEGMEGSRPDFIFEPSPEQLLETLLPRYIEMQIYEAILDAAASEQSARMVAMQAATDAATEMVADLTLTYNKARQELITSELLDIVGGTAALEA